MSPQNGNLGETLAGLWIATVGIIWLCLLADLFFSTVVAGLVGIAAGFVLVIIGSVFIVRAQQRRLAEAQEQLERLEALAEAVHKQASVDEGEAGPGGAAWGGTPG